MRFDLAVRRRTWLPTAGALMGLCAVSFLAAAGTIALSGTKIGIALALAVAFGPVALYGAIVAPLIFPFALFTMAVPFDNLVAFQSFGTLTKAIGIVSAAAMVFWIVRTRRFVVPDRALIGWLLFVVFALCSLGWEADVAQGTPDMISLTSLFGLYAIVSVMPISKPMLRVVSATVIAGGALAGLYGAYLFHNGTHMTPDGRLIVGAGTQMIDPNHFGAALLLPLALVFTTLVESRSLLVRVAAAVCGLFIASGMLLSASRGGIIAAIALYLYLLIRERRRIVLAGIGLAGLAVGLGAFSKIAQRFSEAAATGGAGRLGIWRVGLEAFKHHPIMGAGFGNFSIAYNNAFLTVPAFATMQVVEGAHWSVAPHNNIVWIAVELGTIGLALFLGSWWLQYRSLTVIPESSDLYSMRITVEAALVGLFVAGLFLGTVTYKYVWLTFMLAALIRNAELWARRRHP